MAGPYVNKDKNLVEFAINPYMHCKSYTIGPTKHSLILKGDLQLYSPFLFTPNQTFTLYTLTSVSIFSTLFSMHLLRC